jgi:hypothetical protein
MVIAIAIVLLILVVIVIVIPISVWIPVPISITVSISAPVIVIPVVIVIVPVIFVIFIPTTAAASRIFSTPRIDSRDGGKSRRRGGDELIPSVLSDRTKGQAPKVSSKFIKILVPQSQRLRLEISKINSNGIETRAKLLREGWGEDQAQQGHKAGEVSWDEEIARHSDHRVHLIPMGA